MFNTGRKKKIVIGVDEAGRGPLLGDLIIGFTAFYEDDVKKLETLGVRDSKELSPKRRRELLVHILKHALTTMSSYVSPYMIDRYKLNKLVSSRVISLFSLFHQSFKNLYDLETRIEIYIDEIKGFRKYVEDKVYDMFGENIDIFVMEERADQKYVAVSAASVLAKYVRDRNLSLAKTLFGDFGSGYPSDPKTREWVREKYSIYREPPPIIRRSWGTLVTLAPNWYRNLKRGVSILDYFRR